MTLKVGKVVSIKGVKIILQIDEASNKDTLYYKGEVYKGISIREHLIIQRGFKDIVCLVEGEYLDASLYTEKGSVRTYQRRVEVKPIGYFEEDVFREGIKFLPMIDDPAHLLPEAKIRSIYSKGNSDDEFVVGNMLQEDIPVSLPWKNLFNSHIGIFGNTGSGKSNTLANLYTVLFRNKAAVIRGKSKFILVDFNGEYTGDQLIVGNDKFVLNLSTKALDGDKFPLHTSDFWNSETQSILFKATANTQTPFLNRVIRGRERFLEYPESLLSYIKSTLKKAFTTTSPKRESAALLRNVAGLVNNQELIDLLDRLHWHSKNNCFFVGSMYFDGGESQYEGHFGHAANNTQIQAIDSYDELQIRANLQLANDLLLGHVQFEFIQPLLKRIEASVANLKKVISIEDSQERSDILTIVSLRQCNQETKKIVPLLLAKHYYESHKNTVGTPPDRTLHLIIDEAHNILSDQSIREIENWKDYRLELFEEIIKEGRKFGMFLTIASQRPADISPTITSQIHNFFIHRLVNDKDLYLIDSTISTLDSTSKSLIPNLGRGSCIVTGTSFELPIVMQMNLLEREAQPDSNDVNLDNLWGL